jgi:hypothetical protein
VLDGGEAAVPLRSRVGGAALPTHTFFFLAIFQRHGLFCGPSSHSTVWQLFACFMSFSNIVSSL